MGFLKCASKYSKQIIYCCYSILMLYGAGILIWGLVDEEVDSDFVTHTIRLSTGVISVVNAALGLYGTGYGEKCLVYLSICLLFVTCIVQILAIIVRITLPYEESTERKAELQTLFDEEEDKYAQRFQKIELKCCGVNSYNDYEEKFDPLLLGYPPSCCGFSTNTKCTKPFEIGCHQKLQEAREYHELVRAIIFLVSSFLKYVSALVIAILTIWGDDLV
ncbi:tetraspanin-1-like isoform X2 [Zophobas morio]|uniref:tetraspanin-1-like isoform X2 n=1 Tax=Zophobas morio TaxID=2755281 RepID=UPI0030834C15